MKAALNRITSSINTGSKLVFKRRCDSVRLLFLFFLIGLSSCITQQKCNERFPLEISDSIKTETVYKDVIIHDTIVVDGREIVIHDSVPCAELVYNKVVHEKGLTESVKIFKGVITANCKQDSLQLVIDSLFKVPVTTITESKNTTQKETTNILTKWQSFLIVCGYMFWISWLLFAVFTAIRLYLKK